MAKRITLITEQGAASVEGTNIKIEDTAATSPVFTGRRSDLTFNIDNGFKVSIKKADTGDKYVDGVAFTDLQDGNHSNAPFQLFWLMHSFFPTGFNIGTLIPATIPVTPVITVPDVPVQTKAKYVVIPEDYGAKGGDTDDTKALQAMFNDAIANNYHVQFHRQYKTTSRIDLLPVKNKSEFRLDITAYGVAGINYSGTESCLSAIGWRFSNCVGFKMGVGNAKDVVGIDLDTKAGTPNIDSTSNVSFRNCHIGLGNATGQRAWRLGHVSGSGADISIVTWDNCSVYGNYGKVLDGQIGWHIEGSNTLQNVWNNCFGAFLDRMFSNQSGIGASGTGNGACYFYGCGGSHNKMDFQITNAQTYVVSGGRFEEGYGFFSAENTNISAAVVIQGVDISRYRGNPLVDGNLFNFDAPGSFKLDSNNIGEGIRADNGQSFKWDSRLIRLGGGGVGRAVGRLLVDGGTIAAAKDQFYSKSNAACLWYRSLRGVGMKNGVENVGVMTDLSGML